MSNFGFLADDKYQNWRTQIVSECHAQVCDLNRDLVSVRLRKQYVEKYSKIESFTCLTEGDKGELIGQIAPLVYLRDDDEYAKRFDNFMYGLMLASIEGMPPFDKPVSIIKLFDKKRVSELIDTITKINDNATKVIA